MTEHEASAASRIQPGDQIAVFDPASRRWTSAYVVSALGDSLLVATRRGWWGVVPRAHPAVRAVHVVRAVSGALGA
jgi:hypothetical protein